MQILELINAAIHWFFRIWIVFGMAGGGALILRDELRLRQLQPRPEEIGSYADALVLRRGEEGVPRERNRHDAGKHGPVPHASASPVPSPLAQPSRVSSQKPLKERAEMLARMPAMRSW